jgi:hypothetical protein
VRALDPGITETQHRALVRRHRKELLQAEDVASAPVVVAGETLHAPAAAPSFMHEQLPELLLSRLKPESRQALQSATAEVGTDQVALQALFIAALLAAQKAQAQSQLLQLAPLLGAELTTRLLKERQRLERLPPFARLPTLAALLPRLSDLPDRDRARLVKIARAFQGHIASHEILRFAAARLILQRLAVAPPPAAGYLSVEQAAGGCAVLCAWMASLQGEAGARAYRTGTQGLMPPNVRPAYNPAELGGKAIDAALEQVLRLPPVGKRALTDALVRIVGADQSMDTREFDLLRFVSLRLDVAIPAVPLSIRSAENAA